MRPENERTLKRIAVNASRFILAATFIISGFAKAADPLGTQYKIQEYLGALGLGRFVPDILTLGASVVLSALEFTLGVLLAFAVRRRLAARLILAIMAIMTLISVWLAAANPISDCGCFGDLISLSNGQTLAKNIVLMALSVIVCRWPLMMVRILGRATQWIVINYTVVFILVISGLSLYFLPPFDFSPYKVGADIRKAMTEEGGGPAFETTFLMEKNGERRTFSLEDYPDSTWKFVDSKTIITKKSERNEAIQDFYILTSWEGDDITDSIIGRKGWTLLLVTPYIKEADDSQFDAINGIYDWAKEREIPFILLTAGSDEEIERWVDFTGAEYPSCRSDATTLKTMIRSNPGLMLLSDGKVAGKWSHNSLPDTKSLEKMEQEGETKAASDHGRVARIVMWYVVPLALLTLADRLWAWTLWIRRRRRKPNIIHKLLKKKAKMRKKIVAGNWKMNMNLQEGIALAKELNGILKAEKPNCDVVICTPFIHLASVAPLLDSGVIGLGAENCAAKAKGAYTGEVSAEMVKSTGAQYVILGHSERREYYNETPEILKEKVEMALANGLKIIFCIGESLEQREAGTQNDVVKAELEGSVFGLTPEEFSNIIIAYEPIWAIGTGKTATAEQAEEIHAYIRSVVASKYGEQIAEETSILYGGSCKASNAPELFAKPDIDGGLIGGASLKSADFKGIIDAWK